MNVPGPATVWPTNITCGWVASHSMVRLSSSKYFNSVAVVMISKFNQLSQTGMGIAVGIFKIDDPFLIFCARKPGLGTAPGLARIGHDGNAVVADNECGRQVEIVRVFDRF